LRGALASLLLIQTINWYLNNKLVKQQGYNYGNTKQNGIATEMIKFSIPIALQEALYAVVTWVLSWSFLKFSTVGELGVYQAAIQMSTLLLFVPGILRNVFLAHFSEVSDDQFVGKRILKHTLLINGISVFIPFLVSLIFIEEINQFYGAKFGNIKYLILISCITAMFTSLTNVYNQALLSSGKNWIIFWSRIIRDVLLITCFIILVQNGLSSSSVLVNINLVFSSIYLIVILIIHKILTKDILIK
jgi:O-antigen/teichoic acid export membrane protein